jgi:4-hydroxythreonine-4-phosphate dehydrogenase
LAGDSRHLSVLECEDAPGPYAVGKCSRHNACSALRALETGTTLAIKKSIRALVTAPLNKEALQLLIPSFTGHTEYLAQAAGVRSYAMMLTGGPLRVVVVTTHIALQDVSRSLRADTIVDKIALTWRFLKTHAACRRPRIGVAALNPHAGEGGKMGREEIDIIAPAVRCAHRKGMPVIGPLPADVIFHLAYKGELDAVISMYHDQGLGPLKMIAFETGINITLGLPFIRTSTDHGTAFDIAYKNKAHPGSMISAIVAAIEYSR